MVHFLGVGLYIKSECSIWKGGKGMLGLSRVFVSIFGFCSVFGRICYKIKGVINSPSQPPSLLSLVFP